MPSRGGAKYVIEFVKHSTKIAWKRSLDLWAWRASDATILGGKTP
jgi:hypothetical protein